jgi:hypothetical protein
MDRPTRMYGGPSPRMRTFASHDRLTLRSLAAPFWCQKDEGRRGWFLRQAAGERRLRRHFGFFFGNSALGGAMTRTSRPTRHKEQQPQRSVTATNLISAKGNFVVAFPGAARRPRMTRGRCGSLHLHRKGLAPSTPCRSPGALTNDPKRSLQAAPWTRCFG